MYYTLNIQKLYVTQKFQSKLNLEIIQKFLNFNTTMTTKT